MAIATINPATGETVKTYDEMSEEDVERCLAAAAAAHAGYRLTSFEERAGWMRQAAGILDAEQDQIAAMMTTEMGKTLAAAKQEVAKCAATCRYYAEHAAGFLADEPADAEAVGASRAYVTFQSLGPVLAIMPWNFPLWQAMRFAVPGLMAGNVGRRQPAPNAPRTARLMPAHVGDGGHARRGGAGRAVGGPDRRQRDQEGRAGTGRQRPLHRDALGRPSGRCGGRRVRAAHQQRPVVHRGQALHRPRRGLRRVRAPVHRADGGQGGRGSDGRRHRRRPAGLGAAA